MKELEERRIPRPPNAFMLYGKKNRRRIAQDNPNLTNKQISKILGDNWRKMGADDKDVYHRLANEAHADHMKKYPGKFLSEFTLTPPLSLSFPHSLILLLQLVTWLTNYFFNNHLFCLFYSMLIVYFIIFFV